MEELKAIIEKKEKAVGYFKTAIKSKTYQNTYSRAEYVVAISELEDDIKVLKKAIRMIQIANLTKKAV
jgi:hypothetical protein